MSSASTASTMFFFNHLTEGIETVLAFNLKTNLYIRINIKNFQLDSLDFKLLADPEICVKYNRYLITTNVFTGTALNTKQLSAIKTSRRSLLKAVIGYLKPQVNHPEYSLKHLFQLKR